MQEGDDAGQKLAAELLRVLMSTRQARLALRSVRGDHTLVDCLNGAAPQVQQSAFEALKVLYYSEDGAPRPAVRTAVLPSCVSRVRAAGGPAFDPRAHPGLKRWEWCTGVETATVESDVLRGGGMRLAARMCTP